ncbi:unnamed protein product [Orchesella dallaii]|uniref:Beta-1,4-mannosyl-glycoprotein 4-beta-N-acetylglucosaminyltransferase n=1 Tax=Orchesella dallaii TaxID=48710 RepID=A0ABP1RGN4_9HEXA
MKSFNRKVRDRLNVFELSFKFYYSILFFIGIGTIFVGLLKLNASDFHENEGSNHYFELNPAGTNSALSHFIAIEKKLESFSQDDKNLVDYVRLRYLTPPSHRRYPNESTSLTKERNRRTNPFGDFVSMVFNNKMHLTFNTSGLYLPTDRQTVEVLGVPLYSLISAVGWNAVDFLNLKVNGYEVEILKTIPWDKVTFKVMQIGISTYNEKEQADLNEYLELHDYIHVKNQLNDEYRLYVHKSMSEKLFKIPGLPLITKTFKRIENSSGSYGTQYNSFINSINNFPWNDYEKNINLPSSFAHYSSQLLTTLLPFLVMPPKVKVNSKCYRPPPKFPTYLPPCNKLSEPRKVGVLIQFGFEADTLEIHLNELDDIVDYFFILESTRAHSHGIKKPLFWEVLKHQERFQRFSDKVVHIILDDVDTLSDRDGFGLEYLQEKQRWEKFLRWNNATSYFKDDDILGFGDVDEIPSRNVVFYMKNCEIPSDPVDIGIWFPYGRIHQAFVSDYPVSWRHPYSLGDPTYWTLKTALKYSETGIPSRKRGKSEGHLLGGMHMSYYGYMPLRITKYFTATESKIESLIIELIPIIRNLSLESLREVEIQLAQIPYTFLSRIITLERLKEKFPKEYEQVVYIPWFYNCNRQRYPAWEGFHDLRLD